MKRLVVCCDGTWGTESNPTVSNIVKIAESVRLSTSRDTGEHVGQRVFYTDGPGSRGYRLDKWLGGAFGLGLDAALATMYWQVALNWEEGDEIFIFGFSRGAFTARSLAGMINRLGLLTPDALIDKAYPQALAIYRERKAHPDDPDPPEWAAFRERYCTPSVPIKFLGVFDTVGAMGVPGITTHRYRFHDLRLSPIVHCARQALAIDERRRVYQPCLWEITDEDGVRRQRPDRVEQVWFTGCHGDIGGGNADSRLSDTTLRWMIREAQVQGLEFDAGRLARIFGTPAGDAAAGAVSGDGGDRPATGTGPALPNQTLTVGYRLLNLLGLLVNPGNPRFYRDAWRRLDTPDDRKIYLSSSVTTGPEYDPPNVRRWERELDGTPPTVRVPGPEAFDPPPRPTVVSPVELPAPART
ncbi:DUF2235 domain-containing protein [Nocardia sp. alder85J]|uniref:DUF2235 domain-containing protein n=1 Tax=Nocardia sp. alder85J TaxID=2862949 RepID=UPI001CD68E21|nr:DUF2235 domain-containing protein [Nocardia sp. alder85J]MCX4095141.1 DUF2235 domain-containing protein [Nocardia sp. alder85J]